MKRVKLLTSVGGVGVNWSNGDIVEIEDAYADRLIASNQAVAVADEPKKPATRKRTTRKKQ